LAILFFDVSYYGSENRKTSRGKPQLDSMINTAVILVADMCPGGEITREESQP
jgi:hypothetical protein